MVSELFSLLLPHSFFVCDMSFAFAFAFVFIRRGYRVLKKGGFA